MSKRERARPLSGEIICARQKTPVGRSADVPSRNGDIVDAEFEPVATAVPPPVPEPSGTARSAGLTAGSAGMEMLKRAAAPPPEKSSKRAGPAFYLMGGAIALVAFWISGGHTLMPEIGIVKASIGDGRPVRIGTVDSRVENRDGRSLLYVDGEIFNPGFRDAVIPDVSINVLDHAGRTTRYYLGTNSRRIGAGDRFDFSSRVHVPKDGVKSVSVTLKKTPG